MKIETDRLVLRQFTLDDAPVVRELAGEWDVASTTAAIPHPYETGMAEEWIQSVIAGEDWCFAVTAKPVGNLIGAVGLRFNKQNSWGELGYWIGKPFWGQGYATEAAKAVVRCGFARKGLHRIWARRFSNNPASGRVLTKIGMTHEGCMRDHFFRWDAFHDVEFYGILRSECEAPDEGSPPGDG